MYILKGTVAVELKNGKKIRFSDGESFFKVMNTMYRGRSIDSPAEIIVFYAGSSNLPNTIIVADDVSQESCSW